MPSIKKILIISHDANLNGAPILLLRLMKLLKERGYTFNTLLRHGGPLATDFKKLSEVFGYFKKPSQKGVLSKLNSKFLGKEKPFDSSVYTEGVTLVISNTITNGEILAPIRNKHKGPVICYVHELYMGEILYSTRAVVNKSLELSDYFLVPSDAVKKHLQEAYGVPESLITCLNYYIPHQATVPDEAAKSFAIDHRITASFIIGGIGTVGWRKGTDIFLLIAAEVFKKIPNANIQFVWMGAFTEDVENKKISYDISKLRLEKKVMLLNASAETSAFFKNIDVLLLPSREDAYPVVVLEAAAEKIPTVCFENAGGTSEFICPDAGTVVPYLNIEAMADAVINYYERNELKNFHGAKAFEKVKCLHQDETIVINQFNNVIQNLL